MCRWGYPEGRWPFDDAGRDWSYGIRSQKTPGATRSQRMKVKFSSAGFSASLVLTAAGVETSGLKNCEIASFDYVQARWPVVLLWHV